MYFSSMNNNRKALKSGLWYTISNFLVKGLGLITAPIFTRLLTKAEFGQYSNYTSWLSILTIFVGLSLHASLISARFDYKEKLDKYILSVISLQSIITFFLLVICNLFSAQVSDFLGIDIGYIDIMLVYISFSLVVEMFQEREKYKYNYRISVFVSVLIALSASLLAIILVTNWNDKFSARVIGSSIPTILVGFVLYFYFIKKGKGIDVQCWKYALPICLPYIPHLLSLTVLNSTDRIMISKICGSESTALYSLAYTCGTMVTLLQQSLNSAFSPWLGEKLHNQEYQNIKRFSYVYISLFFGLTIGIMLMAPEMLYVLGGKQYMDAVYVLAPVCMGCACQFLYSMFVNIEQLARKTGGMAVASALAAVVNVVLNLILIPRMGYLAAAYTTLIGFLVLLLIHMILVKKIGYSKVYDYKFIMCIVAAGIVLMVLITMLYANAILRYMVIVAYCFILLLVIAKNRNSLRNLLKNHRKE